jgi:hypothetical protein
MLIACSDSEEPDNSKDDTITIYTVEQFFDFAESVNNGDDFRGKTVVLGADIMLNDTTDWKSWDSTTANLKSWVPIGKTNDLGNGSWRCFNGTFDGAMHNISGLYINNSTDYYQGLFSCLTGATLIKNVKVKASYINGGHDVGGIAGVGSGGTVLNSSFEGVVIGGGGVGGIMGHSDRYDRGKILNSYFIGVINGGSSVGGIIGGNQGKVLNCYSMGEIKGNNSTGGIVGMNWEGTIVNNYSTSIVSVEEDWAGGIVGNNRGMSANNYFAGDVDGYEEVGGIAGHNGGVFQYSSEYGIGTIFNSFWNTDINGGKNAVGSNSKDANGLNIVDAKGMTTDNMKSPSFVETLNAFVDSANTAQTDFIYSKWSSDTQGVNQGYPVLLFNP